MCGKLHAVLSFILQITTCICLDMELDWNKCIICQKEAGEPLRCPLLGPGTTDSKVEAYRLFLENVDQFKAMNSLPTTIFSLRQ